MKKIIKAGMYLSLAAMLVLGTETVVSAHNDWEKDVETEENYYTDGQGIEYRYLDSFNRGYYRLNKFVQSYDVNKKPLFTKIEIRDQIDSIPVKAIGSVFVGHKEIKEISMGNSIWKSSGSFKGCTGLKSIKLSSEITKISAQAFKGCSSLTSISVPDKCTNIGENAFNGCTSLQTIQFKKSPSKLKIGKNAFRNAKKLKTIVLPGNAKTAKQLISALKNPKSVTLYVDKKRVKQLKKTLPCKVRAIRKTAKGNMTSDKIQDDQGLVYQLDKKGYYITGFEQKYDGQGNPLHTVITIPQEISGTSVVGVKSKDVFQYCNSITSVTVSDGIELPEAAFLGCTNLKKVTFTSVKLPTYYVHAIKNNLFRDCNKLEEVTLSEKIYSIGSYAFMNCTALKKMILPKGLCYIKEGAFYNAGLEEVQSEEEELSYLSVGRKAFANCKNLKTVILSYVGSLESHAFYNCTKLEKVILKKLFSNCTLEGNAFENTKWIKSYQQKNKPVIIDGVLINGYYMKGNITLDGKKIKRIARLSFANNQKVKKIKIKGIKTLGKGAFARSSVTEASINGCKELEPYLFSDCRKLKKISVSGIKTIQDKTFAFIPNLKKIIFGKEVTELREDPIYHCPNLTTVRFITKKTIKWNPYFDNLKELYPGCGKVKHIYMNCPKWEPKNPLADWIA